MSSQKKSVSWLGIGLVVVVSFLIAAISIPNLLRSRIAANESARFARLSGLTESTEGQDSRSDRAPGENFSNQVERKIVRTAVLDLIVANVQDATSHIEALAEGAGGYVEKSELMQSLDGQQSADLVIRVPQSKQGGIRDEIKKTAQRVRADKSEARDVTREFIDCEARLRNMKAEEAQYLELMHRSASTKDVIDITARLAEVRGHIEQLQGELRYLSHQVEMSSIAVALSTEYSAETRSLEWHPLRHAKLAFRDTLESLTGFADSMISLALFMPVLLLWGLTVITGGILGWKIMRWIWTRFVRRNPGSSPTSQL